MFTVILLISGVILMWTLANYGPLLIQALPPSLSIQSYSSIFDSILSGLIVVIFAPGNIAVLCYLELVSK